MGSGLYNTLFTHTGVTDAVGKPPNILSQFLLCSFILSYVLDKDPFERCLRT